MSIFIGEDKVHRVYKGTIEIEKIKVGNNIVFSPSALPMERLMCYYNAYGRSNSDANRNVLPDLTGNGWNIGLNNFLWDNTSGWNNNTLMFNGMSDWGQSTANLPAAENNNFTMVLDYDSVYNGKNGIMFNSPAYSYLSDNTAPNIRWMLLHTNQYISIPRANKPFALTNNLAFDLAGNSFINTNAINQSTPQRFNIGNNSSLGAGAIMTFRSMSIWNGVNLDYETCMEILAKMQNNTLI